MNSRLSETELNYLANDKTFIKFMRIFINSKLNCRSLPTADIRTLAVAVERSNIRDSIFDYFKKDYPNFISQMFMEINYDRNNTRNKPTSSN